MRERAVNLLCRILSGSDFDAPQRTLISALLSRLNDKSPSIRVAVLQHARSLYEKHQEFRKDIEGLDLHGSLVLPLTRRSSAR